MGKTLRKKTRVTTQSHLFSQEDRRARKRAEPPRSITNGLSNPFGRICCGSSALCARSGYSWSNHWAVNPSSFRPRKSFNALVTGALDELLTANTGCPSGVSDGFSSEEWASRGWPFGITYTLMASEWKEGNRVAERSKLRGNKSNRACFSMGHVPTVCEMEFLQGLPRGSLHVWARGMALRSRSRSGLEGE
jgi:hypothetical protein